MHRPHLRRPATLFWRVFGLNALVLITAGLLLLFSPVTVSSPIRLGQAATLVAGIAVMLLIDLALMRRSFGPLTKLAAAMRTIDPLKPGPRVRLAAPDRELSEVVSSFNDMLDRLETERRASAHRVAHATDAEQRRIAAELHDEIGQRLTLLLVLLANAQADADPSCAAQIEHARLLAHGVHDDLRGVVVRLRPPALDQLGITKALRALVRSFEQQTGATVTAELAEPDGSLSPVLSLVLYRVAQEAMTNAVRHANGSPICIQLEPTTDSIRLRIADSGPGIADTDRRPIADGSGLRSMAERALLIGGTLDIDSSPAGTTVSLVVPRPQPK